MTNAQTLLKTIVLVNNYSSHPVGEAGFLYCDFWRSRRGHIWEAPRPLHHTLGRSPDMQAVLSFLSDEVDILCVERLASARSLVCQQCLHNWNSSSRSVRLLHHSART